VPAHRAKPQGLRRPHRAAAGAGKHRGGAPSSTLSAAQLHAARCSASKPQDPPTHTRASARTTPGGNATRARRRGLESSLRNRTLTRRAAFTTGMPRSRFRNASCPPRRMSYHPTPDRSEAVTAVVVAVAERRANGRGNPERSAPTPYGAVTLR
jgi:hypothetical protein